MPSQNAILTVLLLTGIAFAGCDQTHEAEVPAAMPADAQATPETQALFVNLMQVADEHVLFGHQDDLAYGVEWRGEAGRSDVKETAGSYPAVYGWELGDIGTEGAETSLDGVRFDSIRSWIRQVYARGGVNTISWHMDNPVSGGDTWDTTRAVQHILPGGSHHDALVEKLDRFADFAETLQTDDGTPIPILFRPYHEMSGGWFWWGAGHTRPEDYKQLWHFTADYLMDERGLHHLLYAYSPGGLGDFEDNEQYWTWYPGDDYVDLLGVDDYFRAPTQQARIDTLSAQLGWLVEQASDRDKLAAFTETGYETIPDSTWWTETLLPVLQTDPAARGIAYVLVWRNANAATDRADHYYAPYPGHSSADDFRRFRESELILFEDELPPLYAVE